jgi:microcystin-dependent protein
MSINNVNPSTWITGTTWVAWGSGRVPVGVDISQTEFNIVEKPGGEKTHVLTIGEMPSHSHNLSLFGRKDGDFGKGDYRDARIHTVYPQRFVEHENTARTAPDIFAVLTPVMPSCHGLSGPLVS